MPIATDALGKSFKQTEAFFNKPNMVGRWLRFAFILLVFTLFTGSGFYSGANFNFGSGDFSGFFDVLQERPSGGLENGISSSVAQEENNVDTIASALAVLNDSEINFEGIIFWIIVVLIVLFVIMFFLRILGNAAMFSAIRGAETGEVSVRSIPSNISKGFSLSLLETMIFLAMLPFLVFLVLALIGFFWNLFSPGLGLESVLPQLAFLKDSSTLVLLAVVGIIGLVFFAAVNYFLGQFGVYLMYRKNINAFSALLQGILIGFSKPVELVILIALQIAFLLVLMGLAFIIGLFVAIFTVFLMIAVIALGVLLYPVLQGNMALLIVVALGGATILIAIFVALQYVILLVLTPVYVFLFNFNLNVLDGFMGKQEAQATK
ncbi:MAG: hypothetical protein J4224_01435 [Candidatus Diapherotrites archaeon]|uniref:Uncharacterized protein n=1 Tax=Candidatus Iainarchaeum sp. TaxID=3101447 RepID=A0A7J4IRT8_9ARCH|nr:MAG: hypothetical protein QT03_C0001G1220 [archaeon GW2011_AR10]MBS3059067.1 hypothetical protein [Candidatus Diapherotrites archaeon]HIH08162.1 hypothetical protein [Candidatus Diapherotrites archaeon]